MVLSKFSVFCAEINEQAVHGQAVCEINEVSVGHEVTLWFDK